MVEQHATKWTKYSTCLASKARDPDAFATFFTQTQGSQRFSSVSQFYSGHTRIFTIKEGIGEVIVKEMLFEEKVLRGDLAMKSFEQDHEENEDEQTSL
jgi:hypothetical protein